MKPLLVTAAIIEKNDQILITQRKESSRFSTGKWEFPGGKVEFLESPEKSIVREIKEELGIAIEPLELFHCNSHIYEDEDGKLHVILLTFLCKFTLGNPVANEGQNFKWINKNKSDIESVDWCEADIEIAEKFAASLNT